MRLCKYLALLFLLAGFQHGLAQSSVVIDSLLTILGQREDDTVKIDIYRELYFEYMYLDHEKSLVNIKKAVALSDKIGDRKRSSLSYLNYGNYHWKRGNYSEANRVLDSVKVHLPYIKHDQIQTTYFLEKGLVSYYQGSYDEALENYFNAIAGYKKLGDSMGIAKTYANIGIAYWEIENLDQALEYYLKALGILREKNEERSLGGVLGNIGLIYSGKQNFKKALDYHQRALAINRKNGQKFDVAADLQNIGVAYKKLGDLKKALPHFNEAYEISKTMGDSSGIVYHSHSLASINLELGNHPKAIQNLQEAMRIAREMKMKEKIKAIYESFSYAYEKMGLYDQALKYQRLFEAAKDSIFNVETSKQIAELETKYQTAEKEKQIALLTKDKELQEHETRRNTTMTNTIIAGLVVALLLASLLFYTFRQRVKNQKQLSQKNAEITEVNFKQQLSDLEMKALRAQMNPHFVFNCLNSINRMILGGDIKDASSYLTKFSRLIRKVLENSEKSLVSLSDELTMLKAYIQLESLRFKGKITYKTEIDKNLNLDETFIPSMVLQPLVENAIWHGLMHKEKGGTIMLSIAKADKVLKCSVEDDGVGRENVVFKDNPFMKEKSMGLQLTNERLKVMGKLGIKRVIEIIDLKDDDDNAIGTRVDLLIPIA